MKTPNSTYKCFFVIIKNFIKLKLFLKNFCHLLLNLNLLKSAIIKTNDYNKSCFAAKDSL